VAYAGILPAADDARARGSDDGSHRYEEVSEMATILLANLGWAGGGPWFLLFPILWIGLAVTVFLVWRGRSDERRTGSAEEILADRYARGEISADELRQRRHELRGKNA
jgi:putative membrane protein